MVMFFANSEQVETVILREGAEALTRVFGNDAPAVGALLFKVAADEAATPEAVCDFANRLRAEIEKATRPASTPQNEGGKAGPGLYI